MVKEYEKITITVKKTVLTSTDKKAERTNKNRSEYINQLLEWDATSDSYALQMELRALKLRQIDIQGRLAKLKIRGEKL